MADSTASKFKWADIAFKFLSVLIIPMMVWVGKVQVSQAVQDTEIAALKEDLKAAKGISTGVQMNTNTLGRVEEKLDATNKRLDDIRADLRRSLPPAP